MRNITHAFAKRGKYGIFSTYKQCLYDSPITTVNMTVLFCCIFIFYLINYISKGAPFLFYFFGINDNFTTKFIHERHGINLKFFKNLLARIYMKHRESLLRRVIPEEKMVYKLI